MITPDECSFQHSTVLPECATGCSGSWPVLASWGSASREGGGHRARRGGFLTLYQRKVEVVLVKFSTEDSKSLTLEEHRFLLKT